MYNVDVTFTFDIPQSDIDVLVEMAGYGIKYWADSASADDDSYTVRYLEDERDPESLTTQTVTYQQLAVALAQRAMMPGYVGEYAREYFVEGLDAGHIDSELADDVVQIALFGRVIYG